MEARPTTTKDFHLALGESIPIVGDQALNNRGQRDKNEGSTWQTF